MGQGPSGNRQGLPGDRKPDGGDKKDKKFEPAAPPARVGRKQRKQKGPEAAARLPTVTPLTKCKLRLLKLERIKDYLLMEEEFVANQERLKPQEEKAEEDRSKVDDLRGSPMSVGNLEELIDENHAIVSSSVGPEYYVGILSFVDKDQLEPGCAILMHNKISVCCHSSIGVYIAVILNRRLWRKKELCPICCGLLQDEVDPMVSVMKVEKAPLESYADIGGLDAQIQEIKEAVELPLTHPELYEDIGDVKVILATNRIESLDPALLRPGRIDRKIEFPLPDIKTRRRIFQIHTSRMTLADDVNLEEFVMTKDEFSGADIKAICTEAGLLALRERLAQEPDIANLSLSDEEDAALLVGGAIRAEPTPPANCELSCAEIVYARRINVNAMSIRW
ncbi:hypothetical protein GH714_025648 [Hevea brasiliensis]|uniref:Proteasomal ATPase OB C-terminal domain-containing protein n=1 Tax=Hevea brasiliensis TaxID=3981 RepID=A0A6A6K7X9_HEVBR|nr:hypothetical protein GH714_025648 [Hevea brasiliensis]